MAPKNKTTRQDYDPADEVKFVLRIPPKLHAKVKRTAKKENTSMNKQIANMLNDHFSSGSVDKKLDAIIKRLDAKK